MKLKRIIKRAVLALFLGLILTTGTLFADTINGTGWKGTANNGTANTGNWSAANWDSTAPSTGGSA